MMFYLYRNRFVERGEIGRPFYPYIYAFGSSKPRDARAEPCDLTPLVFDGLSYKQTSAKCWKVYANLPGEIPALASKLSEKGYYVSQSYIKFAVRRSVDEALSKAALGRILSDTASVIREALSRRLKILAVDVEVVDGKVLYGYTYDGVEVNVTDYPFDIFAEDFDIAVGYNAWGFDVKYLPMYGKNRYGLDTPRGVKPLLDLYVFAAPDSGWRSTLGLQEIASKLYDVAIQLGVHRELNKSEEEFLKLKKLQARLSSARDSGLIREYLTTDVLVTHAIARRWIPILQALGAITGTNPMVIAQAAETASPGHLAEVVIHKLAEHEGYAFADRERQYYYEAGDKVKSRAIGVFRNVAEYDFAAMYPSLYVQDNVDPATVYECERGFPVTLRRNGTTETRKVCFKEGGLAHRVLSAFYRARQITKKLKKEAGVLGEVADQAVKILANSAYGVFGKAGRGIINEWIAGYIAQKTSAMFEDLWKRYSPLYGDTDSLYLQVESPEKVLEEINPYLHSHWGPLMEVKLERVWELFAIPPSKEGRPAEKTYIKISGEEVVLKGGALKPHDLPRGLRFGPYREWVKAVIRGEAFVEKLAREFVRSAELEDLFIESSASFRELFFKRREDKVLERIDRARMPFLARLVAEYGSVEILLEKDGILLRRTGSEDIRYSLDSFIDVLYLPLETREKNYTFAVLLDKPVLVTFRLVEYQKREQPVIRVMARSARELGEDRVRELAYSAIVNSQIFEHVKLLVSKTLLAYGDI